MKSLNSFAVALALISAGTIGLAQNDSSPNQQDSSRSNQNQRSDQNQSDRSQDFTMPEALSNLNLDEDQQQQIRQKLQKYDQQMTQTWREFHSAHMQAVELEAAWVAAVRDTLSEEDQQKFDQKRQSEKMRQSSQRGSNQAFQDNRDANSQDAGANNQDRQLTQDDANQNQSDADQQNSRQTRTSAFRGLNNEDQQNSQGQNEQNQNEEQLWIVTVTSPVYFVGDAKQSHEQKSQCDQACREYKQEIRSAWSDVHQLHQKLVDIEAQRMAAIEEVLNEDQLEQLQNNRRQPDSSASNATSSDSDSESSDANQSSSNQSND